MKGPLLSVIIPVFNGLEYTKNCLRSLTFQVKALSDSGNIMSIVLVDDGSTDGTGEWVSENYPDVHLIKGNGNLWWSGAINKGVQYSIDVLNTEYILWWNNDILPALHYFTTLVNKIKNHNSDTILGSKIYLINRKDIIWGMGGKFDPVSGRKFMYGEQSGETEEFSKPLSVDWFPGMGTCFHSTVFVKVGLLDERRFPQYHGDSDYTYRAKKAGFSLIAFPDLVIYNDDKNTGLIHNGSLGKLYKSLISIKSNQNIGKDIMFFKKHATAPWAYLELIKKYFRYIGGFFKWKLLNVIGVHKT